jgi:hypothetical protein
MTRTAAKTIRSSRLPSPRAPAQARPARSCSSPRRARPAARARITLTPGSAKAPDADNYGVIWLDCCGQPVAEALGHLMQLVEELGGELRLLDEAPTHAIALVHLPRASFARFRGALALAGGSFIGEGGEDQTADTVFILSQASGGLGEGR